MTIANETDYTETINQLRALLQEAEYRLKQASDFVVRGNYGNCAPDKNYVPMIEPYKESLQQIALDIQTVYNLMGDIQQYALNATAPD